MSALHCDRPTIIKEKVVFLDKVIFEAEAIFNSDLVISTNITNAEGDVLISTTPFEPPINFIPITSEFTPGTHLPLKGRPNINFIAVLANINFPLELPTITGESVVRIFNGAPNKHTTTVILPDTRLFTINYGHSLRISFGKEVIVIAE